MFSLVQNDKLELLKTGSLQHLGGNMFAFLFHIGASSHIPEGNSTESEEDISKNNAIYFDILVICYSKKLFGFLGYANHIPILCFTLYITYYFPYNRVVVAWYATGLPSYH